MIMATLKSSSTKWKKETQMKAEGVQEAERKRKAADTAKGSKKRKH
jgi:hypothetical protein